MSTVSISLIVIVLYVAAGAIGLLPPEPTVFNAESWWVSLATAGYYLAGFRIVIIFFQTLVHAIKNPDPDGRVMNVMGHLFLGPVVSILYFYASDMSGKKAEVSEVEES